MHAPNNQWICGILGREANALVDARLVAILAPVLAPLARELALGLGLGRAAQARVDILVEAMGL
jgi:hypothetical protein